MLHKCQDCHHIKGGIWVGKEEREYFTIARAKSMTVNEIKFYQNGKLPVSHYVTVSQKRGQGTNGKNVCSDLRGDQRPGGTSREGGLQGTLDREYQQDLVTHLWQERE